MGGSFDLAYLKHTAFKNNFKKENLQTWERFSSSRFFLASDRGVIALFVMVGMVAMYLGETTLTHIRI